MGSIVGFATLIHQEFFRFWRLIRQTIFPPIITTFLFILIFGYSLGSQIHNLKGFSYIVYIIPGLVAMGVMNNAFSNSSSSLYMAKFDQSIDNLLVAPLRPIELVLSLVIGSVSRGLLVGVITMVIALGMLHQPIYSIWITLAFTILQSIIFGCWGIIGALRAKTWDTLATTQTFIIQPLVYLGGVFYTVQLLPPFWRKFSLFNPIFYMVDGIRYGVLGIHDASPQLSMGLTALLAATLLGVCVWLFQIGYRLVR